jgi:transcriptional regulator of arginine metabolism
MTTHRKKRLLRIMEVVTTRVVRTQEELADILNAEGWDVTQSSVSRDITALRLAKVEGAYRRPAPAPSVADPDEQRIAEGVLAVDSAGDVLLVLHTPPGEANRVAVAIDRLAWPEIAGTIAGDDTIFIAVRNHAAQRQIARNIRGLQAGK